MTEDSVNLSFSGPYSFASGDACLFCAAEAMRGEIYLGPEKNHAEVAALLPDDIRFWAPKKNASLNIRSPEKIAGLGERIDFLAS